METKPDDFDYRSQLFAIRCLLSRQYRADGELEDEIKKADTMATQSHGAANERWVDRWVDLVHSAVYQDATHSTAAVGMIAPFIESVFKRAFLRMGKDWPRNTKQSITETIGKSIDELGMREYMPDDLEVTLRALFKYRNKCSIAVLNGRLKNVRDLKKTFLCGHPTGFKRRQPTVNPGCSICLQSSSTTV